ncbi:hypothetical protein EDD37DRAFT_682829 [Exophiala viscosa]|uniref:uncharacterized protein n=1 Tax=Exophiala viscosa TaxID=2486360 RepID=UPI002192DFA6|nr:hypothetical protein EDD37DRAFT_682829 [Exophiala viscosa]
MGAVEEITPAYPQAGSLGPPNPLASPHMPGSALQDLAFRQSEHGHSPNDGTRRIRDSRSCSPVRSPTTSHRGRDRSHCPRRYRERQYPSEEKAHKRRGNSRSPETSSESDRVRGGSQHQHLQTSGHVKHGTRPIISNNQDPPRSGQPKDTINRHDYEDSKQEQQGNPGRWCLRCHQTGHWMADSWKESSGQKYTLPEEWSKWRARFSGEDMYPIPETPTNMLDEYLQKHAPDTYDQWRVCMAKSNTLMKSTMREVKRVTRLFQKYSISLPLSMEMAKDPRHKNQKEYYNQHQTYSVDSVGEYLWSIKDDQDKIKGDAEKVDKSIHCLAECYRKYGSQHQAWCSEIDRPISDSPQCREMPKVRECFLNLGRLMFSDLTRGEKVWPFNFIDYQVPLLYPAIYFFEHPGADD